MAHFNEHTLELAVMELFKDEGYTYVNGEKIPRRDMGEVLLTADLKAFLKKQYLDITDNVIIKGKAVLVWNLQERLYLFLSYFDKTLLFRTGFRSKQKHFISLNIFIKFYNILFRLNKKPFMFDAIVCIKF